MRKKRAPVKGPRSDSDLPPTTPAQRSRRKTLALDRLGNLPDYLDASMLADFGLCPEDVRRRYPHATESVALDGSACWSLDDFAPLMDDRGGQER